MNISKKVVLRIPPKLVEKPLICRLVKDFDLDFNILKASVSQKAEGLLVLGLSGDSRKYHKALEFLSDSGVRVQPFHQTITRDDKRCTHCGACNAFCPVDALRSNGNGLVDFNSAACIACGLCLKACPSRAMESSF